MVIQWIIIGIIILIGLWALQLEHHTRKIKIAIVIAVVALFYFSMTSILTSDEVSLESPRGIINAVYVYAGWVGQTATNLWDIGVDTTTLVGNAIKTNNTEDKYSR